MSRIALPLRGLERGERGLHHFLQYMSYRFFFFAFESFLVFVSGKNVESRLISAV